jgi:hypothetical protein
MIQRFSDTWRNPMKNAALWAVISFFDSNKKFFDESDEERQNWAAEALNEEKFLFGFVKSVKVRGAGKQLVGIVPIHYSLVAHQFAFQIKQRPFQNGLILHTFSAHFAAIKKTTWIEGLPHGNRDELPRGALALATAAVSDPEFIFVTQ